MNTAIEGMSVRTIYHDFIAAGEVNMEPVYQRHFSWLPENIDLFADSMFNGFCSPLIILYELHDHERTPGSPVKYECIDGQHRLKIIKAMIDGTPIKLAHDKEHFITVKGERKRKDSDGVDKVRLVYVKTDAIIATKRRVEEMNADEKNRIKTYKLPVAIIKSEMTSMTRFDLFNRLQNGRRVHDAVKLRNVNHMITNFLREPDVLARYTDALDGRIKHRINTILEKFKLILPLTVYTSIMLTGKLPSFDPSFTNVLKRLENEAKKSPTDEALPEAVKAKLDGFITFVMNNQPKEEPLLTLATYILAAIYAEFGAAKALAALDAMRHNRERYLTFKSYTMHYKNVNGVEEGNNHDLDVTRMRRYYEELRALVLA